MTSCEGCGFSYESLPSTEIGPTIGAFAARYRQAMAGTATAQARRRPAPEVWSAHEYCCHVRDVLLVQRDRLVVAMVEDGPAFKSMHRDERPRLCHYDQQPTAEVLDQLAMAAQLCAMSFTALEGAAWQRSVDYHHAGHALQDVAWLGRHTVHEAHHHLLDVGRSLQAAADDGDQGASGHAGSQQGPGL